jgi:hypothetical protein
MSGFSRRPEIAINIPICMAPNPKGYLEGTFLLSVEQLLNMTGQRDPDLMNLNGIEVTGATVVADGAEQTIYGRFDYGGTSQIQPRPITELCYSLVGDEMVASHFTVSSKGKVVRGHVPVAWEPTQPQEAKIRTRRWVGVAPDSNLTENCITTADSAHLIPIGKSVDSFGKVVRLNLESNANYFCRGKYKEHAPQFMFTYANEAYIVMSHSDFAETLHQFKTLLTPKNPAVRGIKCTVRSTSRPNSPSTVTAHVELELLCGETDGTTPPPIPQNGRSECIPPIYVA